MTWMGRGLVPVLVWGDLFALQNLNESHGEKDRHKAPSSSPPLPLSLQTRSEVSCNNPIRSSKSIGISASPGYLLTASCGAATFVSSTVTDEGAASAACAFSFAR